MEYREWRKTEIGATSRRRARVRYMSTEHGRRVKESNRLLGCYGITLEDKEEMWQDQKGLCKICLEPMPPALLIKGSKPTDPRCCVDHDHITGRVRGLLCMECNLLAGYLEKYQDRITNALKYIGGN